MQKRSLVIILICAATSCAPPSRMAGEIVPAVEFSRAMKAQPPDQFSIFNVHNRTFADPGSVGANADARAQLVKAAQPNTLELRQYQGDTRYLNDGWRYQASLQVPGTQPALAPMLAAAQERPPAASSAPYYLGQMTTNPSLWPDQSDGSSLFRDMRAFRPMDIVTIVLNEKSEGQKKAETDAESKFSILAAVQNLFGQEEDWKSNNLGLDPANLINATTNSKYEGSGETKREGRLKARLSAVILEVLPNDILRVEGTKIISVDHEEEIMVLSGLVRPKDIDATNQVDSSRIANMRVDFYGRGVVAEQTFPGWFARVLRYVWPF
jgi:flagellar L-ring protein FlgH